MIKPNDDLTKIVNKITAEHKAEKWIKKNKKLKKKNRKLKAEVEKWKDLIEHRKEVSIINHNLYSDLECERDELLEEIKQLKATISKMETTAKEVNDV